MDIETKGLGAGSYPEPQEEKLKRVTGYVYVKYSFDEEFPVSYTDDDIEDYIKSNTRKFDEEDINIDELNIEVY